MFNPSEDLPYITFLEQLHADILVDWHLEIGGQKGRSLAPIRSKTIAVDPRFRVRRNVIGAKAGLHLLQTTGTEAFVAAGFPPFAKLRLDPDPTDTPAQAPA